MARATRVSEDNHATTVLSLSDAECQTIVEILYLVQRGMTGRGKCVSDIDHALSGVGFDVDTYTIYSPSRGEMITLAEAVELGLVFNEATTETEVYYNPSAD